MERPTRLAELVAAMSVATDVGMCHPLETGLATCVTATRLARRLGASGDDLAATYYLALLAHIGCSAGNLSFTTYLGDEVAFRTAIGTADVTDPRVMGALSLRGMFRDGPVSGVRRLGRFATRYSDFVLENSTAVCEVARRLTDRLGVGPLLYDELEATYTRYDGKGFVSKVPREQVPLACKAVRVAQVAVMNSHAEGLAAAVEAVRSLSGGALFPEVVAAFTASPEDFLPDEGESLLELVLDLEPGRAIVLDEEQFDEGLRAFADFADLKCPSTVAHSRAVAELAGAAARQCALPERDVTLVRRAGWIHDIGRITVSAGVWEKRGALSRAEWEQIRLHGYHTERIFDGVPSLRPLAAVAGLHHERGDGSGYHRAIANPSAPLVARVLAAADVYTALVSERPHRPALEPDGAAKLLRDEARAGRLDSDACAGVLAAAGHRQGRRKPAVAGLTAREVEVLQWVARGQTTKQIAAQLVLSPKTVERHLESIYSKAGVRSRAAATLFAIEHDLATPA